MLYDKPEYKNGHITHQQIKYTYKPYNVCITDQAKAEYISKYKTIPLNMSDKKFRFSLDELEPFWEYIISVQVNTSAGFSNFSDTLTIRTRASSKYVSCTKMQSTCFFIPLNLHYIEIPVSKSIFNYINLLLQRPNLLRYINRKTTFFVTK